MRVGPIRFHWGAGARMILATRAPRTLWCSPSCSRALRCPDERNSRFPPRENMNASLPSKVPAAMADIDPELSISSEKVCFIVAKAREFEVKDVATIPDEASNPSDDRMIEVLEDRPSEDAVLQELRSFIGAMSEDEQIDLVALAWLGRGDAGAEGWRELRSEAARAHNRRTASSYLLAMPLLPNYLQDGLAELGFSCDEFERENL